MVWIIYNICSVKKTIIIMHEKRKRKKFVKKRTNPFFLFLLPIVVIHLNEKLKCCSKCMLSETAVFEAYANYVQFLVLIHKIKIKKVRLCRCRYLENMIFRMLQLKKFYFENNKYFIKSFCMYIIVV